MEAFNTLSQQIGEENMLSLCYRFMTFAIARPSEEQRVLLEQKFEQDRHFENLRRILEGTASAAPLEPVPEDETEIVDAPEANAETEIDALQVKAERKAKAALLARAEKFWPFMRVKNIIKNIRISEGPFTLTRNSLNYLGLPYNARFSYMKGLEILAARKNITLETLLVTRPSEYFESYPEANRMMGKLHYGNMGSYL